MALNSWQKITRVIPGKPFGDGSDGALTISSNTTYSTTTQSCSGTSGSSSLTIASGAFSNGDLVIIHQSRGTGVGQWEINKVSSGGGTTTLTMQENLQYTYTDSGASQAQVLKIPQYTSITVNSGITWTVPAWNANVNGFIIAASTGVVDIQGIINANGGNEVRGFLGASSPGVGEAGKQAEGTGGARNSTTTAANGNGGGGGNRVNDSNRGGGGGGGNGTAGDTGGVLGTGTGGSGGGTAGASSLTTLVFGGGGGQHSTNSGAGGSGLSAGGGSAVILFGKTFNAPNSITSLGANGVGSSAGGSGGGAGGSVLLCGETVNIGTDKITTAGGTGSTAGTPVGGNGGKGRIAAYYGKSLSGSLSSTLYGSYTNELDTSFLESSGFFMMF